MASSEKQIAVLPCSQTARPGSQPVEADDLRGAPSSSDSPTPMLDRLVGELEAAFGTALADGASAPSPSRPSLLMNDRSGAGDAHASTPRQESSAHSDKRSVEAVLDGDEWTVSLPEDETNAEAQDRSTGGVDEAETVDQCSTAAPRSRWVLSPRHGRKLLRQVVVPGAILIPLGIGAIALAVVTPRGLPTAIESEAVPISDGLSASIGDQTADDLGRVTMEDGADPDAGLSKVEEPVRPRLVKTVRIREQPDQATAAVPPPAGQLDEVAPDQTGSGELAETPDQESIDRRARGERSGPTWTGQEGADAGPAGRLRADAREPVRTDEALSGMDRNAAQSDRWRSAIHVENDGQPRELIAAEDRPDDTELARNPAEAEVNPDPATAPPLDSSAAEADGSSGSTTGRSAEPSRFAATTTAVNMRSGPTNKAAVVTVVPARKRVGVIGCDAWCEVVVDGDRGWIHSSFVAGGSSDRSAGGAAADLRIAPGMPLIGADGARIGIVRGETTDEAGQVFFLVELAQELGATVSSVWLRKEHFVSADEQARVRFTGARLLRSLPSQSDAEASRDTNAS